MLQVKTDETLQELSIKTKVGAMVQSALTIQVTNAEEARNAADLAKVLRTYLKMAEEERTTLVGPLNDHVKLINGRFKAYTDNIKNGQAVLDRKLLDFKRADEEVRRKEEAERHSAEQARQLAEAEKLAKAGLKDAAIEKIDEALTSEPEKVPTITRGEYGATATIQKRWNYEIVDLTLVPRQYLELNASAVRAAINQGVREIPGLNILQVESLRVG